MRRTGALLLALGYGLSFVVVCLAACLMPVATAHGCCASEEGLRAAEHDCCFVTPGLTAGGAGVVAMTLAPAPLVPMAAMVSAAAPIASPVPAAASPPLVLRV